MNDKHLKIIIDYKTENEGLKNLIVDYWRTCENGKPLTNKYLIQTYSTFGKSIQALENKMKLGANTYIEITCTKCLLPESISISNRGQIKNFNYDHRTHKCSSCHLKEIEFNRYLEAQKSEKYNMLKTESIKLLADNFDEKRIELLSDHEIKVLEIIDDNQNKDLQSNLFKAMVRNNFQLDSTFWKMMSKLESGKFIRIIKSKGEKQLCFVHPETLNIIRSPKNNPLNAVLLPYRKKDIADPDFIGEMAIRHEIHHAIGEELYFSLVISSGRMFIEISDRRGTATKLGDIINTQSQLTRQHCKYSDFFYARLPIKISESDQALRAFNLKHTFDHAVRFNKLSRLRIGIWLRINYLKLKMEPIDLPFIHGRTELL